MSNIIKKPFSEEFIKLLELDVENERVISMIIDQELQNTVDADGTQLVHLAARYNNVTIIFFLYKLESDFEVEDSSGETPLITALLHGNFYIAKSLFYHRVSLLTETQLWSSHHAEVMRFVAADVASKLREKSFSSEQIGEFLSRTECCLCAVMNLRDPSITRGFLNSEVRTYSYTFHKSILFENIVPDLDEQSVRMIFHDGRWSKQWMTSLCVYVMGHILNYERTQAGRNFLRRLFSWRMFNEDNLDCLEEALRCTEKKCIKIFLRYDFHSAIKEKFGRDVMLSLFGNRNPKIITYMLRNGTLRLDGIGHKNNSPLHNAVKHKVPKNIERLLKNGADPNAFNDSRETPVHLAMKDRSCWMQLKCLKPLLMAGVDQVRTCDEFHNLSFFDGSGDYWELDHTKIYVSHLAIYEALGLPTEKSIRDMRNNISFLKLQRFFKECCQELELLKAKHIKTRFSMFSVLAEKPIEIARYFKDEDLQMIAAFVKSIRKTVFSYYRQRLKRNMKEIARIKLCRYKAIEVISECSGINDPNHLVVCKIADYFSLSDFLKFEPCRY